MLSVWPHVKMIAVPQQVRFVELDDRFVVQWALPWEQCAVDANDLAAAPAGQSAVLISQL